MSLTPTPSLNMTTLKNFWQRPEGKTGMVVVVASALAAVYGLGLLLPYLILLLQNTLYAVFLTIALFAVLYTVTNRTFRAVVSNVFQLGMRWLTGWVVELDPIGILRNNLERMRQRAEELSRGVEGCAGAKKQLERQIQKNQGEIGHAKSLVDEADRQLHAGPNPLQQQGLLLRRQAQLQEIGRRMKSNENLTGILNQTNRMYGLLQRWQNLAEFNIQNTEAEVDNLAAERQTILQSYRALGPARRLIKGDPEELKLVNRSLEFLAEDNANKLGEMEDFARYSEKFLTDMDLETGASATDAEKMLANYEQKLLTAATPPVVPSAKVAETDYSGLLR